MDALHHREVPPVSILRHIRPAFALFARQVLRSGRPPALDYVPDFPLRCQHCDRPIARSRWNVVADGQRVPLFSDPEGYHGCPDDPTRPHKPMPSVLG